MGRVLGWWLLGRCWCMWMSGAVLLSFSCGPTCKVEQGRKPRQEDAVKVVWHDVFLRSDDPPEVRWVQGSCLTCKDPNSGRPGFETSEGCREGWNVFPNVVQVAWRDDDQFSSTTLAHEFLHALHTRMMMMPDPKHRTAGFRPLGECPDPPPDLCGIVDRANAALTASSL